MTKTFTFDAASLSLTIPFADETLVSGTREEFGNLIAALRGEADEMAELPEYLSVNGGAGVTISRTLPMSLWLTDEDAQTQDINLNREEAHRLSQWLREALHAVSLASLHL